MKSHKLPPAVFDSPFRSRPARHPAAAFFLTFVLCLTAVLALPAQEPDKDQDFIQITRMTPKSGKIGKDGRLILEVAYKNSHPTEVVLSAILLAGGKPLITATHRPMPAVKGKAKSTLELWVREPLVSDEVTVFLRDMNAKKQVLAQTKPLKLTWAGPSEAPPAARKP